MFTSRLFHKIFKITYGLHIDSDTKSGRPIVFLHGIASDSSTWKHLTPLLPPTYRVITIDLLGFGKSPKPDYSTYSTAAHAASVIKTLRKLNIKNAIIVGHSMGGLIAVEVAKKRPELVSGLILVSAPLYNPGDIIEATSRFKGIKRPMSNGLFTIYERVISNERISLKAAQAMIKLAPSSNSFTLSKETWLPFKRSLTNTIMKQNSMLDILGLQLPTVIIFGKLDLLIQSKNYETLNTTQPHRFTLLSYNGTHMVTKSNAPLIFNAIIQMADSLKDNTDSKIAANT